jgi:HEAT repeat protein
MATFFEFIMTFQRALKALQLYTPAHPRGAESISVLHTAYGQLLQDRTQIQIAARNGRIFVDRQMEDIDNHQIRSMARIFEERGIHAMLLYPEASAKELGGLLTALNLKPAALRSFGGAKKFLEDQGVTRIRILDVRLEDVSEAGEIAAALLESVGGVPSGTSTGGGAHGRIPLGYWPSPSIPGMASSSGPGPGVGAAPDAGPGSGSGPGARPGSGAGTGSGAGPGSAPAGSSGAQVLPSLPQATRGTGPDIGIVIGQVQGFLASLQGEGHSPVDLSGFGAFLEGMGLDRQGNQPNTQGVVMKAVSSLETTNMLGVMQGAAALRPGSLRNLFGRLSSTIAAPGLASTFSQGTLSPPQIAEAAERLQGLSPSPQTFVNQLEDALRQQGMSEAQLSELVDILTWESRPTEERIKALLQGQRIFEMPTDKVLAFLRELLEAGRNSEFLRLLRHYASGLMVPAVARRLAVAQAFEKIADWVDIPGMPTGIQDVLIEILTRAYGREKDPDVHLWISRAVEHLIWFWVDSNDPLLACALFEGLQDVVTELSLPASWKEQATEALCGRLSSPERLDKLLGQLFAMDRLTASAQIHPYLRMLGAPAANHLMERLSHESDRTRRNRLLEALKACGQTAEAPLLESLTSPEWFVVRNALIVLGEVASPERVPTLLPLLDHADQRVQTAAVRTVGRLGGREAEAALGQLLATRTDPHLLLEVLFVLDRLKARNAALAILALLKSNKGRSRPDHEQVREKAIEVLGHLGSPAAIPELAKLLHREKGFFRDSKEALPIRLLALRALRAVGTPEARAAIDQALFSEPAGPEWDALQEALAEASPAPQSDSR